MSLVNGPNDKILYAKEAGGIFEYMDGDYPDEIQTKQYVANNNFSQYDNENNVLWTGGYTNYQTGILHRINLETKEVTKYDFPRAIISFELLGDNKINLVSGTNINSELITFDYEKREITDKIIEVENEKLRGFKSFDEHHMLISSSERLFLLHLESKESKNIIEDSYIQSFAQIKGGWAIGTSGNGVHFLDEKLNTVKVLDSKNGLSNDQIYSIIEDKTGNYWVGTGNGLNVIDKDLNLLRRFLLEDGISDTEFNTNAATIRSNGNLLFGTTNGVTEVMPQAAIQASESQIFHVSTINYQKGGENLSQVILSNIVHIPIGSKNIALTIESNDFFNKNKSSSYLPRKINIVPEDTKYKLIGNELKIPKLNTPSSLISIIPANESLADKMFSLNIDSKKNYTSLLIASALIALIILLSYLISKKIIKNNQEKARKKSENAVRMAELELQALRSQMNPHFIFNSLGAILLYMQTNEKKKAERYLTKFAKLMRMFLESSKAKFISFEEEEKLLGLYLELEKLRFEEKFNYQFQIDDRIDKNSMSLPSMLLQPFVENSINHGLYHKKGAGGELIIKAIPDGENIKVIIHDNGIGREEARKIREQSLKKHRSRATEIIQERILVLKKEKNINIDINYKDLIDENGNALGTSVEINLPKIFKNYD